MRILLRPQCRTVNLTGRRTVARLLRELGVVPGTAMVIRNETLLLDSEIVEEEDDIEVRAVISGGAA